LSFPSAVELCQQVERYAPLRGDCHGAVLADTDFSITERVVFEGDIVGLDHVLGWMSGYNQAYLCPQSLLISMVSDPVDNPCPFLMLDFVRHRGLLAVAGLDLCDWMIHDGFSMRSMAFTVDASQAWPEDPICNRSRQLGRTDPGLVLHDLDQVS